MMKHPAHDRFKRRADSGIIVLVILCIFTGIPPQGAAAQMPGNAPPFANADCTACHAGLAHPKSAAQSHPGKLLAYHPVKKGKCIDCHMPVTLREPSPAPKACPVQKGYFLKGGFVQASCGRCHQSTYRLPGAAIVHRGENLFRERGCSACHVSEPARRKYAPPLNGISAKLKNERWLPAWLQGPRSIRPGTMMPDFGLSPEKAGHVAAFLLSLSAHHPYKEPDLSQASAKRGVHYFTHRGCSACHKTHLKPSERAERIPSLNDAGTKFRPAWVLLELEDPRAYNPDARIPLVDAAPEEVLDIIAYLETLTLAVKSLPAVSPQKNRQNIKRGRDFVETNGCFACHRIKGFDHLPPPAGNITPGLKISAPPRPWEALSKTIGLTAKPAGTTSFRRMPLFNLRPDEVDALVTFWMTAGNTGTAPYRLARRNDQRIGHEGEKLIHDYGCRRCHGVDPGESPYVTTVIQRGHLLPPKLAGEGAKVQPQWLARFLEKPVRMRIWMTMGMPHFYLSRHEIRAFVQFFRQKSGFGPQQGDAYHLPFDIADIDDEEAALGRYRFQHDRCAQCHPANLDQGLPKNINPDDLAIDLLMTKERLRYEWVRDFLRNPDRFAGEGTRMPFIYFTPEGLPKVPDASLWLERVAKALYFMETLPEEDPTANTREVIDVNRFWENY